MHKKTTDGLDEVKTGDYDLWNVLQLIVRIYTYTLFIQ